MITQHGRGECIAQDSTAQHRIAQHSTAQHSTGEQIVTDSRADSNKTI
jgi:hypothetical protein